MINLIKRPIRVLYFRLFEAPRRYIVPPLCKSRRLRPKLIPHLKYVYAVCNGGLIQDEKGDHLCLLSDQTFTVKAGLRIPRSHLPSGWDPTLKSLILASYDQAWFLTDVKRMSLEVDGMPVSDSESIGDARLFRFRDETSVYATGWSHNTSSWPLLGKIQGSRLSLRRLRFEAPCPQKNWMPFSEGGKLFLEYSVSPHMILECDPRTLACHMVAETKHGRHRFPNLTIHGGAPAIHLSEKVFLGCANTQEHFWFQERYYGTVLYLFDATPPFATTHSTDLLRIGSNLERVRYICGMILSKDRSRITFSVGVNDWDNCIITMSVQEILSLMQPIGSGRSAFD